MVQFGWKLIAGDVNQDGFLDLIVGAPFAGGHERPQESFFDIVNSNVG